MSVRVGDPAPDFELQGVDGASGAPLTRRLSELRGHRVVLAFYPADNSRVCTAQLAEYTEQVGAFGELDAEVLAISPQSPESHRDFAAAQGGFGFPLLSDEDKAVAGAYGNLGLLGLYRRCTYVVDTGGRIAWAHRSVGPGIGYRGAAELLGALESAT